jgi:hypothetical protein
MKLIEGHLYKVQPTDTASDYVWFQCVKDDTGALTVKPLDVVKRDVVATSGAVEREGVVVYSRNLTSLLSTSKWVEYKFTGWNNGEIELLNVQSNENYTASIEIDNTAPSNTLPLSVQLQSHLSDGTVADWGSNQEVKNGSKGITTATVLTTENSTTLGLVMITQNDGNLPVICQARKLSLRKGSSEDSYIWTIPAESILAS